MELSIATAPVYPSLQNGSTSLSNENIYRLNRTNSILEELKAEKEHYASTYKKYKKIHKTLYGIQLLCNATSVTTGGCAVGTVASGIGMIAAVPLGAIGMISGGIGIVFGIFDQKILKKMKKHSKLVLLCQTTNNEILRESLNDHQVTKEEFTEILKMMETFYVVKDDIREKKQFVGNLEKFKKEYTEQGKKLAYLEALQDTSRKIQQ